MAVYDDEKEKQEQTGHHDDLGVHPEHREAEAKDLEEQYNAESAPEPEYSKKSSPEELKAAEEKGESSQKLKVEDAEKSLYRPEKQKVKIARGFIRRRKVLVALGVSGLLGGIGFGLFVYLSGPLQIIHFAQLLRQFHLINNEDFLDGRTARLLYHYRSESIGTSRAQTRLGIARNRSANLIERRLQQEAGIRSLYNSITGRLEGYEIIDLNKAVTALGDNLDSSADFNLIPPNELPDSIRNGSSSIDGQRPTGGVITFRSEDYKLRRQFTRQITRAAKVNRIAAAISARMLIKRGGIDFHPLKNVARSRSDSFIEWYEKLREERSERRKQGITETDSTLTGSQAENSEEIDPDSENTANRGNNLVDEAKQAKTPSARRQLARNLITRGGGAAAVIGAICVVHDTGSAIGEYKHTNIIMPMMRIGGEIITTGNQVMHGNDVNADELGAIMQDLYDEETGASWNSARSIQAELGQDLTGSDIPPEALPGKVDEKPALFEATSRLPFINQVCGVGESIGNFVRRIPVFGKAVEYSEQALVDGINGVLGIFGGKSVEEYYEGIVAFFAGEVVDTYATGADLGNIANYGARLAANDHAIAYGGRELSGTEVAVLDQVSKERFHEQQATKSFFARTFNAYDANSLVAGAIRSTPKNVNNMAAMLRKLPSQFMSTLFTPVAAQSTSYDYGFNEFGFSLQEQEDPRFADPLENADIVENQLELNNLNEEYGDCFATRVDTNGNIVTDKAKRYDDIDGKCSSGNENLLRYRFYIADTVAAHSLACYAGEATSCTQLGFNVPISQEIATPAVPASGNFRGVDTSAQQCSVGQDAGIASTPDATIKIRLCNVDGIVVNVAIESNVKAVVDGGQTAGLTFSAISAYRSYESQVALRRKNCGTSEYAIYSAPPKSCSPETAIPGRSLHEWGLAVDFRCNGQTMSTRSSPCFVWLDNNQSDHKLTNLPSEPWHWSSSGN